MRFLIYFIWISLFFSCGGHTDVPDVSNIQIELTTKRFEQDFFSLDTNKLKDQVDPLIARYTDFGENFLGTILNVDPKWNQDTTVQYLNGFIRAYRPLYDTTIELFGDFSPYEAAIKKGLQYFTYYFPSYNVPKKIITYIGPLDGYGDILSEQAFIIGLQHHLGKNASFYQSTWLQETYPKYLTDRFGPEYIAINCMKNLVLDIYPEKTESSSLVNQMIAGGIRMYLLQQLLPETEEYLLLGYSDAQMKACYKNEKTIWNLFTQNNLLQNVDYSIIKNYIGESPKTQELGEDSPGNIGTFAGWQIVKKYMSKYPKTSPAQLISLNTETILEKAKYKP